MSFLRRKTSSETIRDLLDNIPGYRITRSQLRFSSNTREHLIKECTDAWLKFLDNVEHLRKKRFDEMIIEKAVKKIVEREKQTLMQLLKEENELHRIALDSEKRFKDILDAKDKIRSDVSHLRNSFKHMSDEESERTIAESQRAINGLAEDIRRASSDMSGAIKLDKAVEHLEKRLRQLAQQAGSK